MVFSTNIFWEIWVKIRIGYFKTKKRKEKKVPMATKLEGGKALVAGPLKKNTFFAASLK